MNRAQTGTSCKDGNPLAQGWRSGAYPGFDRQTTNAESVESLPWDPKRIHFYSTLSALLTIVFPQGRRCCVDPGLRDLHPFRVQMNSSSMCASYLIMH